jgi:hypothetical protein
MTLEIQNLAWDRHKLVAGLNWLMGFQPPPLLDNSISYGNAYMFLTFFILQATELRPGDITFWNHLKNAQIASGDDEGADDTDQIISYLQNYYQ